jgi:hypothetical protein
MAVGARRARWRAVQRSQVGIRSARMSGKMVSPGTWYLHSMQEAVEKEPWHWMSFSGRIPALASMLSIF